MPTFETPPPRGARLRVTCPIRIGRITHGQADLRNAAGGIQAGIAEGTAVVMDAHTRLDDVVIQPAA
jgi:hypothetical protein